jgi:hypothetical protein
MNKSKYESIMKNPNKLDAYENRTNTYTHFGSGVPQSAQNLFPA